MSRYSDRKFKTLAKMAKKWPNALSVYNRYKFSNFSYHQKHKTRSRLFLLKLILNNKRANLVKWPKRTFSVSNTDAFGYVYKKTNHKLHDEYNFALSECAVLNRLSADELISILNQYDVISFDVFDTCIFRPFLYPTDIFYILEEKNKIVDFPSYRLEAERLARSKKTKQNFECNIFEIYDELSKICYLDKKSAYDEIKLEKEVCYANQYMLKVFKALKKKHKLLVATSDMYLPSNIINDILKKNGFVGFNKIIVSCEHDCNKSSGELFDVVRAAFGERKKRLSFAHIGDNANSDVNGAKKSRFVPFFYENCNNFGYYRRPQNMISPTAKLYKGVVNNYCYNGISKLNPQESFGFMYGGIAVVGFCEEINRFVKAHDLEKIVFLARDMDIVYKIYNDFYKEFPNVYATTSRYALQEFLFKDFTNEILFHTINSRMNRGYTVKRTFVELNLQFLLSECKKHGISENAPISESNLETIRELCQKNIDSIQKHFKDSELAAKQYFKSIIGKSKKICLVDLGWRGSVIGYLNYLLVKKWKICSEVKGIMFGSITNNAAISMVARSDVSAFAFDFNHNREYTNAFRYGCPDFTNVLAMEALFSSTEDSLLEYAFDKKHKKVCFVSLSDNPNKKIIANFQNGIKTFVEEFESHRSSYRNIFTVDAIDAFEPLFSILKNRDYIARIFGNYLEPPYQFAGHNIPLSKYISVGATMAELHAIPKWPLY